MIIALVVARRGVDGPQDARAPERPEFDAQALVGVDEAYRAGMEQLAAAERNMEILRLIDAGAAMERALEADSVNLDVLTAIGHIRMLENRYDEAVAYFDFALFQEPMQAKYWGLIADAWLESGQYRYADSCYHRMLELDTGFESLMRASRGEFELHGFESALAYADQAIAVGGPDNVVARGHVQLADMLTAYGHWEEARRNLDLALALAPDDLTVLRAHAELLILEERIDEAADVYRGIIKRSPHPTFKSDMARVYRLLGEDERARELVDAAARDFDRLARAFPDRMQREQADFLVEWGLDPERAQRLAYRASRNRNDFFTYELLARTYLAAGQPDLAWSSISLALRRRPQHPRIFYTAAVAAKAAGLPEKFETYATRARELNPRIETQYGPL